MGSADTPLTRIQRDGCSYAPTTDLLTVALSRTEEDMERNEVASATLLRRYGLHGLVHISPADLKEHVGLEGFESHRMLASIELGRRTANAQKGTPENVSSYSAAKELFRSLLKDAPEERFCAAFLDTKNQLIHIEVIHKGTINMSVVGMRDVMRAALRCNAVHIIVAHNHPSGVTDPSPSDIEVTRKLMEAAELLDMKVLDHVIVGNECISLKEEGLI